MSGSLIPVPQVVETPTRTDDGAMKRALFHVIAETDEPDPLVTIFKDPDEPGKRTWQCRICPKFVPRTCKADKVYDMFKSHVIHVHDEAERHPALTKTTPPPR